MKPATLHAWIEAAGGRRFLLTLGCGIVSSALLIVGCLSETGYVQIILGTVAAFITGVSFRKDRVAPQSTEDAGK